MNRVLANFLTTFTIHYDDFQKCTLGGTFAGALYGLKEGSFFNIAVWGIGIASTIKIRRLASISEGCQITYKTALALQAALAAFYACKTICNIQDLPELSSTALNISNLCLLTLTLASTGAHCLAQWFVEEEVIAEAPPVQRRDDFHTPSLRKV